MADVELGAPMFKAVVVKKDVTPVAVVLKVRYHRKHFFDGKRKVFTLEVPFGNSTWQQDRYNLAQMLQPGDELFVDGYGEEWSDPLYHNALQRKWNLRFF